MSKYEGKPKPFTPITDMSLAAMQAEYASLNGATGLSQELRDRRAELGEAIKAANRQQRQACAGVPATAQASASA